MSDLIDRQAALEALCNNCDNPQAVCPHYPCKQYTSIEALPSAQPEVKPIEYRDCANPPMVNITATWISGRMKNENGRLNQQTSCD